MGGEDLQSPYEDGVYHEIVDENMDTDVESEDFGMTKNTKLTQDLAREEKMLREVGHTEEEVKSRVQQEHRTMIGTAAIKQHGHGIDSDEAVALDAQGIGAGEFGLESNRKIAQRAMGSFNQLEKDSEGSRTKRELEETKRKLAEAREKLK